jgi:hypothetical protein
LAAPKRGLSADAGAASKTKVNVNAYRSTNRSAKRQQDG